MVFLYNRFHSNIGLANESFLGLIEEKCQSLLQGHFWASKIKL